MSTSNRTVVAGQALKVTSENPSLIPGYSVEIDLSSLESKGGEAQNWTGTSGLTMTVKGVIGEDANGNQRYLVNILGYADNVDVAIKPDNTGYVVDVRQ